MSRHFVLTAAGLFVLSFGVVYLLAAPADPGRSAGSGLFEAVRALGDQAGRLSGDLGAGLRGGLEDASARPDAGDAAPPGAVDLTPQRHHVVIAPQSPTEALFARARTICAGRAGCEVQFWPEAAAVPSGDDRPTEAQKAQRIAVYVVNRFTGEGTLMRDDTRETLRTPATGVGPAGG